MNVAGVNAQIEKLESEIVSLKAEIYDRIQAIEHLQAVAARLAEEEVNP